MASTTYTTYQSPYKPTPTSTQFDTLVRWLRLQKYRIEVTYGVYVFTPMEKAVFWTLVCFFFLLISTTMLLYAHQSMTLLVRAVGRGLSSNLASHLPAKHAATRLTTSAQTRGAEKAMELLSGASKSSQVA
ncbi:hypothetical protein HD806DRAFT_531494 [Xylariaceae sp. AK1471]|nr:hypothetical protein HD806DRAFT_531494 [Xylariaceae sp. AK1471]